ncbi:MAG: DUF4832 domain-containing protein [Bryobacteraceae bacterium]|nr:DUF4832 domain-containing protein [Bryobacteraceae bacterium]
MMARGITLCLAIAAAAGAAADETIVIRPVEIDDVLVNPGMGVQTFQRFNGDALNPGKRWSEVGPTERLARSGEKPDYPDSSIAYFRWFWRQIEPEEGRYRWEIIDLALEQARERRQRLAIRLMPYDEGSPLPEWYRNSGARRANKPEDKDGKIWSPDAADPLYMKHWGGLVKSLAARYDGHPYMDSVDISTVGYWGEGWGPHVPDWPSHRALIDLYLEGFRRTPLLVNFDEPPVLAYATSKGTGWRLDCWGDMEGPYWESWGRKLSHMLDFYPLQLVRAEAQDAWQRGPVSLETCWTPEYWKDGGFDLNYIIEQALRWHASSVNIKSSPIPAEWKQAFEEFQKKMGYRLVLRRVELPKTLKAGSMAPLSMWWVNKGVAPVYGDYRLALQLRSEAGGAALQTRADIRKWLPGDALYEETVYVPEQLRPGTYRLRTALLDPRTQAPEIRLAIEGRQPDGWYDLGGVEVR